MKWAIITGEYPPQPGGVSDYTHLLAGALAETGDEVHVWAPTCPSAAALDNDSCNDVIVHRLERGFGISGLAHLGRELDALPQSFRILVQYVPHAFGWRAMNLPFCLWLSGRRAPVWVMFHEVVFPMRWSQPLHHNLLGLVTRLMAALVLGSSERVFVTTPAWERFTRRLSFGSKRAAWLPVPSTIGEKIDPQQIQSVRSRLTVRQGTLIGHFGTYGPHISEILRSIVPQLLRADEHRHFLLLGRGSGLFLQDLVNNDNGQMPRDRMIVLDGLSPDQVRAHLAACDLVLQPYPDGITTRRTSSMAALALGVPILTNVGDLSEPLWRESRVVALAKGYSANAFLQAAEELLLLPEKRADLRDRAMALYSAQFSIENVVKNLRASSRQAQTHGSPL